VLQLLREITDRVGSSDRGGLELTRPVYPESKSCSLEDKGPAKQVIWEGEEIFRGG